MMVFHTSKLRLYIEQSKYCLRRFYNEDSGQAIVEFVLLIAAAISMVAVLKGSMRASTTKIWQMLAKRISAPCHKVSECKVGSEFDL